MIKRHWIFFLVVAIAFIGLIVGIVIVLNFQITTSWVGNYGAADIGEFSIGTVFLFIIQLVLWELLLVFLPGGLFFGILGYYWWKKVLTPEERELVKKGEEKEKAKKLQRHGSRAGGGLWCMVTIIFLIIVFIQGNWLTSFNSLPYTYYIYTWIWSFIWFFIIVGFPAAIIGLIWYFKYSK